MKILYVVPGPMSRLPSGAEEMKRRLGILSAAAAAETQVEIDDIPDGPPSIESEYDAYLSIPGTLDRILRAERDGCSGVIIGCYGDPGLDAARELVEFPVAGPGETSLAQAALLGRRFSIITVTRSAVLSIQKNVRLQGWEHRVASILPVGIPVLDLRTDPERAKIKILKAAESALKDNQAEVLILGCMSMGFLQIDKEIQVQFGVPVINPALTALKFLESQIQCGLKHSKKAYPFPGNR